MNKKAFYTVIELAAILNVQEGTIYKWTSTGRIPFKKFGDRNNYVLEDVLNALENNNKKKYRR
jgi:excisionase family DNA binding protein